MKISLSPAEAIKELNNSKLIKSDTANGYMTIQQKSKSIYEVKIISNDEQEPVVMRGSIKNVMKTLNDSRINGGFYLE